jgi:hypothetical protein
VFNHGNSLIVVEVNERRRGLIFSLTPAAFFLCGLLRLRRQAKFYYPPRFPAKFLAGRRLLIAGYIIPFPPALIFVMISSWGAVATQACSFGARCAAKAEAMVGDRGYDAGGDPPLTTG